MSGTKLLLVSLLTVPFLAPFVAFAQSDAQRQLIAADRGILEAMEGPHPNVERSGQLLAPDYIETESGESHSREEVLKQLGAITDFSFQYENPRAVLLSPTSGYVIAEVSYSAIINGFGAKSRVLSTTIFTRDHERWLARLHTEMIMNPAWKAAAAVSDSDPALVALRQLATQVEAKVHIPGYPPFSTPKVALDAGPEISYFDGTVHEAQFRAMPDPMQALWNQWASYTTDEPSGQALFDDMFHRFFFVHELGHWMAGQVIEGLPEGERKTVAMNQASHKWNQEIVANRISVAWFRDHDPQYLAKLINDFRRIQSRLPDPVPAGTDKKTYFTENYRKLGSDPLAYGWYQLQMVLVVYDEPARSFQQVLDALPRERYE